MRPLRSAFACISASAASRQMRSALRAAVTRHGLSCGAVLGKVRIVTIFPVAWSFGARQERQPVAAIRSARPDLLSQTFRRRRQRFAARRLN